MSRSSQFVSRMLSLSLVAATALNGAGIPLAQAREVERPPQFVLLAFDGSLNNGFWNESRAFAKATSIKYTYFISGVYFLLDANKTLYNEPARGAGKSAIGWGGKRPLSLSTRVEHLNLAFEEGNELGSHANGHFDGSHYTLDQWKSEFTQFWDLIFNVFKNNPGVKMKRDFLFTQKDIVGFRAPQLGRNADTDRALVEEGFTYDTSRIANMNYWPRKADGLWNFPLARVTIAGSAKQTLSMDFNFYVSQSKGVDDLPNAERYEQEMLQTYQNYFLHNYNGNRAPVHIGHHFAKWNGAAYWKAMKRFSQTVCKLPEVKCVTYSELEAFMEAQSNETISAYQAGHFPRSRPISLPRVLQDPKPIELAAEHESHGRGEYAVFLRGKDFAKLSGSETKAVWSVNGREVATQPLSPVMVHQVPLREGESLRVSIRRKNREILSITKKGETAFFPFVSPEFQSAVVLPEASFEDRALLGDLPEAHSVELKQRVRESRSLLPSRGKSGLQDEA